MTSILEDPRSRVFFQERIRRRDYHRPRTPMVPPTYGNARRTGVALDFALRFGLAARGYCPMQTHLVSSSGVELIRNHSSRDVYRRAAEWLDQSTPVAWSFAPVGPLTDEQAVACCKLGSLDLVFRCGDWREVTREIEQQEFEEVQKLYAIIPWESFRPRFRGILNPTFNQGSILVDGADGDLVIDDLLVDIKTTRDAKMLAEYIRQLVGYAVLANAFGMDEDAATSTIKRVGVYFSRYAALAIYDLAEIIGSNEPEILHYLCSYYEVNQIPRVYADSYEQLIKERPDLATFKKPQAKQILFF